LNGTTGSIARLQTCFPAVQYVDTAQGNGLNEFLYVDGLNAREALKTSGARITIKERGPLVASFAITSRPPGCNALTQEVRVVNGLGRVDVINTIDKENIRSEAPVDFLRS
jgi:hypothetical protein